MLQSYNQSVVQCLKCADVLLCSRSTVMSKKGKLLHNTVENC